MNRIYWNQNLWCINPPTRQVNIVCINNISPMAKGCFIWVNIILDTVLVVNSSFISGGSLI
jgi:hypothetical protein